MEDVVILFVSWPITTLLGLALGGLSYWIFGGSPALAIFGGAVGALAGFAVDRKLRPALRSVAKRLPRGFLAVMGLGLGAIYIAFVFWHRR